MEVPGTVVGWKDGIARVQIAAGACADCQHGCVSRQLARPSLLTAVAAEPLEVGQVVKVDVALPSTRQAVTMAFALPLLGFMAGLLAGNALAGGEPLPSLGMALVGAAAAYAGVAVAERRRRRLPHVVACRTEGFDCMSEPGPDVDDAARKRRRNG